MASMANRVGVTGTDLEKIRYSNIRQGGRNRSRVIGQGELADSHTE